MAWPRPRLPPTSRRLPPPSPRPVQPAGCAPRVSWGSALRPLSGCLLPRADQPCSSSGPRPRLQACPSGERVPFSRPVTRATRPHAVPQPVSAGLSQAGRTGASAKGGVAGVFLISRQEQKALNKGLGRLSEAQGTGCGHLWNLRGRGAGGSGWGRVDRPGAGKEALGAAQLQGEAGLGRRRGGRGAPLGVWGSDLRAQALATSPRGRKAGT